MTTRKEKNSRGSEALPRGSKGRANTTERPTRSRVSGHRDLLTVYGKDPNKEYRLVHDQSESGARILRYQDAGWELVPSTEISGIGDNRVYKTENVGSIVRVPAGVSGKSDGYLYLMSIRKEWYDEDQAAKQQEVSDTERTILADATQERDGRYGSITVGEASS